MGDRALRDSISSALEMILARLIAASATLWSPTYVALISFGAGVVLGLLICTGGCRI